MVGTDQEAEPEGGVSLADACTSTTLAESFEVRHGYVFDNVGIVEATAEG
jgi:hypothetical protein